MDVYFWKKTVTEVAEGTRKVQQNFHMCGMEEEKMDQGLLQRTGRNGMENKKKPLNCYSSLL